MNSIVTLIRATKLLVGICFILSACLQQAHGQNKNRDNSYATPSKSSVSINPNALVQNQPALINKRLNKKTKTEQLNNVQTRRVAFYYGPDLPVYELAHFDELIVQSANCTKKQLGYLQEHNTEIFAYFSIGEVSSYIAQKESLPESWFVGSNTTWDSNIVDLRNTSWQDWLINNQVKQLQQAGYNGLFLDTLDSYKLAIKTEEEQQQYQKALLAIIKQIKQQYPDLKLHLNRGFDLVPELKDDIHAISAESLLQAWNEDTKQYYAVKEQDKAWLLQKLRAVKNLGISVNVVDYVDPAKPALAIKTASDITSLGFTPWVSTPALDIVGRSNITPIPRRLLVIYDSAFSPIDFHPTHITLGSAFDYLGLRVEYHDIQQGTPTVDTSNIYAGIVSYLSYTGYKKLENLEQWLLDQKDRKTPIVFYEDFPFTNKVLLDSFGIGLHSALKKPLSIISKQPSVGDYEIPVSIRQVVSVNVYSKNKEHESLLRLSDTNNKEIDPVLITEWGGLALGPFTMSDIKQGVSSWVIDPIIFFKKALKLGSLPVADVTTENGNRILTSHIDGDGFASKAELKGSPYSAEVILNEVLKVYKIPHTVSVIEGEIGKEGLYPELSATLEGIARKIFSLDHIEAASHSFSHPFVWQTEKYPENVNNTYGLSLDIPGYEIDLKREILGSINYINNNLLSNGKKVKTFLWTGDALPGKEALSLLEEAGVRNLNGANTKITNAFPSTTQIYPQSRMTEGGLQVYAPIMNENVYSNDWQGPFYGFNKVIETIKLTGNPRRYKPISIYWHFYSGTKLAALMALHDTYQWALKLPHTALPISEYAAKVEGAYTTSFAKRADGALLVQGLGDLRTLRISNSLGYPDIANSDGVAGYTDSEVGRFLHLSKEKAEILFTKEEENKEIFLERANASLSYWKYTGKGVEMRLKGYEPLDFTIRSNKQCTLNIQGKKVSGKKLKGINRFQLNIRDTRDALLVC